MTNVPRARSGVPITDELADRLADEAETGYELANAKRVGRRSLSGAAGSSPRVNFRMTAELQARAEARADREGKTITCSSPQSNRQRACVSSRWPSC